MTDFFNRFPFLHADQEKSPFICSQRLPAEFFQG